MNTYAIDPALKRITEGMIKRAERPVIMATNFDISSGPYVTFRYQNKRTGLQLDFDVHPLDANLDSNYRSRTNQISVLSAYRVLEKTFAPELVISASHPQMARLQQTNGLLFEARSDGRNYVDGGVHFTSKFEDLKAVSDALQKAIRVRRPNLDALVDATFALWDVPSKRIYENHMRII